MQKSLALALVLGASAVSAQGYGPDADCHALTTGSFQAEMACQQEQLNYESRKRREDREEALEWQPRRLLLDAPEYDRYDRRFGDPRY
jgi:hypothetical protein